MVGVTVIIPTYNNIDYIFNGINSIINQSYKNWELIIVDDACKDGTFNKVKEFINENKYNGKMRIIKNKKNKGCYFSLNRGLKLARGKYICILGSDDTYHLDKLKIQTNILNKNKRLVGTIGYYLRGKTLKGKNSMAVATLMFRKNIITKIGYFDSVRYSADDEFLKRIYTVYGKNRVRNIRKVLYYAISRPNSLTTSKKTGFKNGLRQKYWRAALNWHQNSTPLKIPFPLKKRPFPAPKAMRVR